MDRAVVTQAIKTFHDVVAHACVEHPGLGPRLLADQDAAAFDDLLERACAVSGIARADFEAALAEDPSLRELQKHALDEVLLEPNDPGPHAEISRESPAGTPENYHVHLWNGVSPPGGVGGSKPPSRR